MGTASTQWKGGVHIGPHVGKSPGARYAETTEQNAGRILLPPLSYPPHKVGSPQRHALKSDGRAKGKTSLVC